MAVVEQILEGFGRVCGGGLCSSLHVMYWFRENYVILHISGSKVDIDNFEGEIVEVDGDIGLKKNGEVRVLSDNVKNAVREFANVLSECADDVHSVIEMMNNNAKIIRPIIDAKRSGMRRVFFSRGYGGLYYEDGDAKIVFNFYSSGDTTVEIEFGGWFAEFDYSNRGIESFFIGDRKILLTSSVGLESLIEYGVIKLKLRDGCNGLRELHRASNYFDRIIDKFIKNIILSLLFP